MQWADAALFPLQKPIRRMSLEIPGLIFLGGVCFSTMVSGGFLFIVGLNPTSALFALTPYIATLLALICLGLGYCWRLISCVNQRPNELPPVLASEAAGIIFEGAQLLFFYLMVGAFLTASAILLFPYGIIIPIALIGLYPLLVIPMVASVQDRTLFGLLDACLDIPDVLGAQYLGIWFEITLYGIIAGGVVYPILIVLAACSVLGLNLVPGLFLSLLLGFIKLSASLCLPLIRKLKDSSEEDPLIEDSKLVTVTLSPYTKTRSLR